MVIIRTPFKKRYDARQHAHRFPGSAGVPGNLCACCLASYRFLKGVLIMTILPVADSARLLGIHPKTLHHWLKEANVPLATHPRDARMKCVTEEHLQQVARLHGRPLPSAASSLPLDTASAPLVTSQAIIQPSQINEVEPASTASSLPAPYAP